MSEATAGTALVVGAGIVGASCALFLQRDGWHVRLVDPRPPGNGASLGNAGVISVASVLPIATPGLVGKVPAMLRDPLGPLAIRWRHLPGLLPWLLRVALATRPERAEASSKAIAALAERAEQAHDLVIQQCGLADLVRPGGWLKVAFDADRFERATALEREFLGRRGRDFELLGRDEVLDLEPALNPEVARGLLLPHNRAVRHPQRYVEGIVKTLVERGGELLQAEVTAIVQEGGRVTAAQSSAGTLPADLVVLAAGAFSKRLAAQGGASVPLEAERGYHLMLPHPEPTLHRPVYTIEGGFVLAPMEHGVRLTGGVELASAWAEPDFRRIRGLLPRARRLVPGLDGRILSEWQGSRPSLPDSLPVIGRAPGLANMLLAFGHQHIGLTLGPLTGRLIADLAAGRDPGVDLEPYRPRRSFV